MFFTVISCMINLTGHIPFGLPLSVFCLDCLLGRDHTTDACSNLCVIHHSHIMCWTLCVYVCACVLNCMVVKLRV